MKKSFCIQLILIAILFPHILNAQFELWGMTRYGGNTQGVIFKTDNDGSNFSLEQSFENFERKSRGTLIKASNGKFYGMSEFGGNYDMGVLFEYNYSTNVITVLHNFDWTATGANPTGNLMQATNGKLYGMTPKGGIGGVGIGVLFEYDIGSGILTKLHDFMDPPDGSYPYGSLIQAGNGKLYGMTYWGGLGWAPGGTLFEYDISSGILIILYEFTTTDQKGIHPIGDLLEAATGKLYGLTKTAGTLSYGTLFEYDINLDTLIAKHNFDGNPTGSEPKGSLIKASNGKLYGMTRQGGVRNQGVLFEYDQVNDTVIKKHDFDHLEPTRTGSLPEYNNLTDGGAGILYGMVYRGGSNDRGVLFEYNTASGVLTKRHDFADGLPGKYPWGSLVVAAPDKLLGMTYEGGTTGKGVLFEYDTATHSVTNRHSFDSYAKGQIPWGSLTATSNGKLYGVTRNGGIFNNGVLFEYDIGTGEKTKLHDFDGTATGSLPKGSLIEASNGKLYGMTEWGGASNWGVIFEFDPATGTLSVIHHFNNANGAWPCGNLLEASNGKLYGLTRYGASFNCGVLFEYDITSATYTLKQYSYGTSMGRNPYGSLIEASNGKLYGLAKAGGSTSHGVLFEYDIALDTIISKHDFNSSVDGREPEGSLTEAGNGKLYGLTSAGGPNNYNGTLFEFDPGTGDFALKHDFDNTGGEPKGTLVLSKNGKLYGMTSAKGTDNKGILFEYDTLTSTVTKILDFDGSNGDSPYHTSLIKIYVSAEWTGANSTDWHDAGNWLHGDVPWPFTSVTIPDVSAGSENFPVVSLNVIVREIDIAPNAVVNVQNGATLKIGIE